LLSETTNFLKQLTDVDVDAIAKEVEAGLKPTPNGGKILEKMVNFFKNDDWHFNQIEGKPVLYMAFQGENGQWTCYANARVQHEQIVFYSVCPVNAPENKRQAMAEFLTQTNYGMIVGNFELDFVDGKIRYKTSIDVKGTRLSSALIKQIVYANVAMMDKYLPGIMSVIYSEVSPEEAIAQIEG
jgi:hypothetical protein